MDELVCGCGELSICGNRRRASQTKPANKLSTTTKLELVVINTPGKLDALPSSSRSTSLRGCSSSSPGSRSSSRRKWCQVGQCTSYPLTSHKSTDFSQHFWRFFGDPSFIEGEGGFVTPDVSVKLRVEEGGKISQSVPRTCQFQQRSQSLTFLLKNAIQIEEHTTNCS